MKIVRMPLHDLTLKIVSYFFSQDHIFNVLDDRIKTFYGVHKYFEKILSGDIRVYGSYDSNEKCVGFISGSQNPDAPEVFEPHLHFARGVDAAVYSIATEKVMADDYAKDGVQIKQIVGNIPDCNRASRMMAKRAGYVDGGLGEYFVEYDGALIQCRRWVKNVR